MNEAAPSSSPIASAPEFVRNAAKVENTSGEPFEKARNVTPACENGKRELAADPRTPMPALALSATPTASFTAPVPLFETHHALAQPQSPRNSVQVRAEEVRSGDPAVVQQRSRALVKVSNSPYKSKEEHKPDDHRSEDERPSCRRRIVVDLLVRNQRPRLASNPISSFFLSASS